MLKMKIKTYLKSKKGLTIVAAFIVVLGLLGGGGLYLAQSKNKGTKNIEEKVTQETATSTAEQTQENLSGKENAQSQTNNTATSSQSSVPVVTSAVLNDVSIQAIKSPDGSIFLSLYGPQGTYDVEKCTTYQASQCSGGWVIKSSNQSYSGHGGLPLETINIADGSPSYIIYKVENNKRVSSSKPIVVNTATIVDTKSFIGE